MSKADIMFRRDRFEWILDYIRDNGPVDVLNNAFVTAYVAATGAVEQIQPFGANHCPMLGADLGYLYRNGHLQRSRIGLPGSEPGFPKWVYVYELGY